MLLLVVGELLEINILLDHKCSQTMCGGFVMCQLARWNISQNSHLCVFPVKMINKGDGGVHTGQSEAAPFHHLDLLSFIYWLISLE